MKMFKNAWEVSTKCVEGDYKTLDSRCSCVLRRPTFPAAAKSCSSNSGSGSLTLLTSAALRIIFSALSCRPRFINHRVDSEINLGFNTKVSNVLTWCSVYEGHSVNNKIRCVGAIAY